MGWHDKDVARCAPHHTSTKASAVSRTGAGDVTAGWAGDSRRPHPVRDRVVRSNDGAHMEGEAAPVRKCFSTDGRFHVYAQRVTEDKKPCSARRPYFCVPARFGCGGGDVAPLGLAGDGDSLSASAYQISPAISRVASSRLTLRALFAGTSWLLCERAAQLSFSAERTHVQWATSPTGGPRQFMGACSPSPIAQPPAGMAAARSPPWPTATSCASHHVSHIL